MAAWQTTAAVSVHPKIEGPPRNPVLWSLEEEKIPQYITRDAEESFHFMRGNLLVSQNNVPVLWQVRFS
jgi:hypothetical protein